MRRLAPMIALGAILIAQGVALDRSAAFHSDTVDESTYMAASTRILRYGRDRVNREQPPLTKWLMAAVLDAVEPQVRSGKGDGWEDALWGHPPERMSRNLRAVRWVNIGFSLAISLLLFVFMAARWGAWSGVIAAALLASSPLLSAHGSLATMDAGAAFTSTLVMIAFWRWWEAPSRLRAAAVGCAWALALLAKSTAALLLVPLAGLLIWRLRSKGDERRTVLELVLSLALISPALLWASYDFQVVTVTEQAVEAKLHDDLASLTGGRRALAAMARLTGGLPVPLYDYLSGIGFQAVHARGGHHSFLDGEVRYRGWPSFYLRSIAYETPLLGLLLGFGALLLLLRRRAPPGAAALLLMPAWWLLYFSLLTPAQGGLKYLLPALPFWAAFVAATWRQALRSWPGLKPPLIATLLLLAFFVHRIGPNYLMFFNAAAGGPERGWTHLVHGKDWGQGQRQLGEWQRSQQITRLWYARYHGEPRRWGVRFLKTPCRPVLGYVAAHVSELQRPERHIPIGCLDWLKELPPIGHFAHSILLWRIDGATFERWQSRP